MTSARTIRIRNKKRGYRVTLELRLTGSLSRFLAGMTTIERENTVATALHRALKEQP